MLQLCERANLKILNAKMDRGNFFNFGIFLIFRFFLFFFIQIIPINSQKYVIDYFHHFNIATTFFNFYYFFEIQIIPNIPKNI